MRFINRQKGAGTRLLLDRLIEREGLKTRQIKGYAHEEFTHNAIATSILAGQADAGMGLQYIAKEFSLSCIPLENYLQLLFLCRELLLLCGGKSSDDLIIKINP